MIKRTIEISAAPAHLTARHEQLVLQRDGETVGSVPCEDLGLVVVDHPGTTYSHAALMSLLDADAVLVVCGRDHLPSGMLLPLSGHTEIVHRIEEQIAAPKPLRKQLWKQLVQAKIRAQAGNLDPGLPPYRRLMQLADEVRSGDPSNREAQAARIYWQAWLVNGNTRQLIDSPAFQRSPEGGPPNSLLNYGYSIVRAAMARALVGAGLIPAIGLYHSNRSNAFCLADDLIEPLRPIVDVAVRDLYWSGTTELDRLAKQSLLELLEQTVCTADETGPLMVAMHRMVASLVHCFQELRRELEIPVACRSAGIGVCGS